MNKFEKAQKVLNELNADGWLIVCKEDTDVHSHYLLGVKSHARHYIYISTDGNHKVISVEMEAPMIKRSLKNKGLHAEVIIYKTMDELLNFLSKLINKTRIALNFGENVLSENGSQYADYIYTGDYFSIKQIAPKTEIISAAPIIYELRSIKSKEELDDFRNVCKTNIEILETIPDWVKVGMTEREVKAKLEY
ncbi:MAG: aminopeptidase P family N-terminal domain-containing protein, partial [Promethearchaeota archaeon]